MTVVNEYLGLTSIALYCQCHFFVEPVHY